MEIRKKTIEELLLDLKDKFNINDVQINIEKRHINNNDYSIWFSITYLYKNEESVENLLFGESYNFEGALFQLLKNLNNAIKPKRIKRISMDASIYGMDGIFRYE